MAMLAQYCFGVGPRELGASRNCFNARRRTASAWTADAMDSPGRDAASLERPSLLRADAYAQKRVLCLTLMTQWAKNHVIHAMQTFLTRASTTIKRPDWTFTRWKTKDLLKVKKYLSLKVAHSFVWLLTRWHFYEGRKSKDNEDRIFMSFWSLAQCVPKPCHELFWLQHLISFFLEYSFTTTPVCLTRLILM